MAVKASPFPPSHARHVIGPTPYHCDDECAHQSTSVLPSIVLTPPVTPPSEAETETSTSGNDIDSRDIGVDLGSKPVLLHDAKAEPDASEWKPDSSDVSPGRSPASRPSMAAEFLAKFHRSTTEPGRLPTISKKRSDYISQRSLSFQDCRIRPASVGREADVDTAMKDGGVAPGV